MNAINHSELEKILTMFDLITIRRVEIATTATSDMRNRVNNEIEFMFKHDSSTFFTKSVDWSDSQRTTIDWKQNQNIYTYMCYVHAEYFYFINFIHHFGQQMEKSQQIQSINKRIDFSWLFATKGVLLYIYINELPFLFFHSRIRHSWLEEN